MAGYQTGNGRRVGPFDLGDDNLSVDDWMASRNAHVAQRAQAELAGRQAWVRSIRNGQNVSAAQPSDLRAAGMRALQGPLGGASFGHGYNPNEPRDEHGRWTTGGAVSTANAAIRNAHPKTRYGDAWAGRTNSFGPSLILANDRRGMGGNEGPPLENEAKSLLDVFPGLKNSPAAAILSPIDGFLGITGPADAANLDATLAMREKIIRDIQAIDPRYVAQALLPPGGIADLSWEERSNLIDGLRMDRTVAYYKILGDVGPLQVETLRFLQKHVDRAYADGLQHYNAGRLNTRLGQNEAVGNYVDNKVRRYLREFYNNYGISFGKGQSVGVNNRDYDTSGDERSYTVPDARVANVSYDWTLTRKSISTTQVRGFFRADTQPGVVVIVRPTRLGGSYAIPRPAVVPPRR